MKFMDSGLRLFVMFNKSMNFIKRLNSFQICWLIRDIGIMKKIQNCQLNICKIMPARPKKYSYMGCDYRYNSPA